VAGLQQLNWDSEGVGSKAAALVDLSTVAGNKISNPPWVKFQSAGWVNFPSAPTIRTIQRQGSRQPAHLNSQQSAVAFQYAKVLEHAMNVFGTQKLAEEWLGRPCKHLDGDVPLDVIDNPFGFQAVEDYLERIEYGVYQ